jgi:hypothetical protein
MKNLLRAVMPVLVLLVASALLIGAASAQQAAGASARNQHGLSNWSASVGSAYMWRMPSGDYTLLVDGNSTPIGPTYDALFKVNSEALDIAAKGNWYRCGLDFRGLTTNIASASGSVTSSNGAGVLYATTAEGLFFPPLTATAASSSRFESLEANAGSSAAAHIRLFAGVRFLVVNDFLNYTFVDHTNSAITATQDTGARNRMIGPQIGFQGNVFAKHGRPFDLSLTLKAADLGDFDSASTQYDSTYLAAHALASMARSKWVQMGETDVRAHWHATSHLSFGGGYDFLALSAIANPAATQIQNAPPLLNSTLQSIGRARTKYQGVTFQAVYRF